MENVIELDDMGVSQSIAYMVEKRNDALEHLNDLVKTNRSAEVIKHTLDIILRHNVQIKKLEDALVAFNILLEQDKYKYSWTKD